MPVPGQHPDLLKLGNQISKELYDITPHQAIALGICVDCKQEAGPRCTTEAGRKEYRISGMCEVCFDGAFGEPEEEDFEDEVAF